MWGYLSKRFEGRENATTKLYTQRTLRQKLENASCRYGADVENHLSYVLSLREQLAALDADVGDAWMVDILVRSMSQFEYYQELHTLTLLGSDQMTTPLGARAMIITLERNAALEREQKKFNGDPTTKREGRGGGVNSSFVGKKRVAHDHATDSGQQM